MKHLILSLMVFMFGFSTQAAQSYLCATSYWEGFDSSNTFNIINMDIEALKNRRCENGNTPIMVAYMAGGYEMLVSVLRIVALNAIREALMDNTENSSGESLSQIVLRDFNEGKEEEYLINFDTRVLLSFIRREDFLGPTSNRNEP